MISKMTKEEEGDQGAAGAGPIDGRTQCSEYSKSNNQLIRRRGQPRIDRAGQQCAGGVQWPRP